MSEIEIKEAEYFAGDPNEDTTKSRSLDGWLVGVTGQATKRTMLITLCFSRDYSDDTFEAFSATFDKRHIKKLIRDLNNVIADLQER